ncbi:PspC domain-containing protein [Dyadobacter tibetensis]|uniref:PspC domain-containing protein n=1 Tax=Dyadobacter tibetensis TaxID=1211851 RepID=UPI0004701FB8|nr:PspC domain-containing protein [Dyadobacter tibetensis]
MERKLYRIPEEKVVGGVAAGLAQYMQIDVVIIRVIMVIMLILPIPPSFGWTGFIYLILWAALPTGPALSRNNSITETDDMGTTSDPVIDKKRTDQTIMVLGGALVFFGVIMLVDDFPIWYQFKQYFWPILLISVGAYLILRQRDQEQEQSHTNTTTPPSPPSPTTPPSDPRWDDARDRLSTPDDEPKNDKKDDDDDVIRVN